jgi:putative membrane protein
MKYIWISIFWIVLLWSGVYPKDQFAWFLEVAPALLGGIILVTTYNKFRLTPLLYALILVHCVVLMIGGHYTYAEVPFFDALFGADRNNYDKVGHLFKALCLHLS